MNLASQEAFLKSVHLLFPLPSTFLHCTGLALLTFPCWYPSVSTLGKIALLTYDAEGLAAILNLRDDKSSYISGFPFHQNNVFDSIGLTPNGRIFLVLFEFLAIVFSCWRLLLQISVGYKLMLKNASHDPLNVKFPAFSLSNYTFLEYCICVCLAALGNTFSSVKVFIFRCCPICMSQLSCITVSEIFRKALTVSGRLMGHFPQVYRQVTVHTQMQRLSP